MDWEAIREEVMHGVLLCVQDFVGDPVFSQRYLFSETGVTILSEAVAICDSITNSFVYAPWSEVESKSTGQVIGDLKTCFEKALDFRRVVNDTSEKWYALCSVRQSSGESSSEYGVRKPTAVGGKLIMYSLFLHPIRLLVQAVLIPFQEIEKRKCPRAQLNYRDSLKFQISLPVHENVQW